MIPDVEERLHIERYVGSNLITVKSPQQHGYAGKQQTQSSYKQFQNARYAKFVNDNSNSNTKNTSDTRPGEHAQQRYPFSPKCTGAYGRNTDSRTNCWSGYPLISFNSGRRDNQNTGDQPRHYYANVGGNLKTYSTNVKPSKCSFSDFVTNKQGVPLIQANGKFQDKPNWERENRNFQSKNIANGQNEPPNSSYCGPGSKSQLVEGREHHGKNDCADENYGNSENCLPRIIKPRKRRKKDRKPSAGGFTSPTNASGTLQTSKKVQEKSDKPIYKIHSHVDKAPDSSQILHNLHLTLYRPKSKPLMLYQDGSNVNDLLISRSLVNLFSEDSPQLLLTDDLRFDILGKDTSSSDSSQSTTTFCNCRYCDPEGVVWDIRQRCFSPNLMPPGEGTQIIASVGKLAKNKDWSTTLKRSCSEPASKPSSTPVVPRVRALSDSYDTTHQNLQVSSEIVTSLNGHRDIEIKFFSSSRPTSKI